MKKILLLLLFFIPTLSLAQQTDFYDKVYLKSGYYVKGMITSMTEEELTIMDMKGKNYTFKMNEIDRMEKEDFDKDKFLNIDPDNRIDKTAFSRPYYFLAKLTLNRSYEDLATYVGATASGGIRFGGLGIGLGVGYTSYTKDENESYLPVMIDARYTFYYKTVRPYLYINPGYSFKTQKRDGYMFAAGVGANVRFNEYLSGLFELGYYWQEFRYNVTPEFVIRGNTDFFVMNIGIGLF